MSDESAITAHEPSPCSSVHILENETSTGGASNSSPIFNSGGNDSLVQSTGDSTGAGGEPGPKFRKRRRVRTGCLQCKRRRVRCDENGRPKAGETETAGRCEACDRLGLVCTWPSPAAEVAASTRSSTRRGAGKKRNASWSPAEENQQGDRLSTTGDVTMVQLGCDQITRAMVDAFFQEVYPCSVFGFLRKNLFYESFENGDIPKALLMSLCSLSVKYVIPKHEEQSRSWSAEAKSLAHRDIERGQVTASTLSSLIFCFHQELFNRIFGAAWMTSGVAIRLAFALRFNLTPNTAPIGTRPMAWADGESRRRMMWAVYVMDMYVCDGFPEYSNVPRSSLRIQLPCDEESFVSNQGYESGTLGGYFPDSLCMWQTPQIHPRSASSPFVQYITIFSIRTTILRYVRKKSTYQDLPWQDNSTVSKCETALRWWKDNLPVELELNNAERVSSWSLAELSTIFSLHLWHCMSYCDLGRLTIFGFIESAPPEVLLTAPQSYVSNAQNRCVEYASKMLELSSFVLEIRPDFVSRDPYMASCLYQATRIILWDIFRHPSPSVSMKAFAAGICQPAIIMLHRLAGLFSYAGSVMEDTFSLLRRYGMQDTMASRLPKEIANALHQQVRIFKPGPAIFLDASEQSALRESPEPSPMATDRGESELFRPPFHSRKDVRIELDANDNEALTPSSASWTTPSQIHWNDSVLDSQSNTSYAPVYTGSSAAPMNDALQTPAHNADLTLRSSQTQNSHAEKSDLFPSAISSVTPGIFDSDPGKDRESQFLGDMSRLSCFDPLGQSWPPMYTEGSSEM